MSVRTVLALAAKALVSQKLLAGQCMWRRLWRCLPQLICAMRKEALRPLLAESFKVETAKARFPQSLIRRRLLCPFST